MHQFLLINFLALVFCVSSSFAGCIPFSAAPQHVGEKRCVKGRVIRVEDAEPGFTRLNFCDEAAKCPFSALVAASNAEVVAGLRGLEGKSVNIRGMVKTLNGDALIVLQDSRQLLADDSEAPSFLKSFDVEERGHYSAGTSRAPKNKGSATKKRTVTLPIEIPEDSEE